MTILHCLREDREHTQVRGRLALQILVFCVLGVMLSLTARAENGSPADSKWRVRGRVIGIIPDDSSSKIQLEAGRAQTPLGAGVSVDEAVVPELDLTYMITPHFGVEVIAGIANHDVYADGSDATLASLGVGDGMKLFDV